MKKRIVSVLTAAGVLFCLFLTACGKETGPSYVCSVETFEQTTENGVRCYLGCPVVQGHPDEKRLNEALAAASAGEMERWLLDHAVGKTGVYRVDEVTNTCRLERLASFLCVGSFTADDAAEPETVVYTLNLDPETGRLYTFDELVSDFSKLAAHEAEFRSESGAVELRLIAPYIDLYHLRPPLYFLMQDGELRVGISVEVGYFEGGHAEYTLPVEIAGSALTGAGFSGE